MKELTVKSGESGQRFDKYLARYLKEAPKSFLYKMLRKKNITLNGKKADGSEKLQAEDTIQLFFSDETLEKFMGQEKEAQVCPLEILYEDADVLLKSGAMTKEDLQTFHPAVCNRLDRNTSGIVAAGKTMAGLQTLSEAFHDRSLHKYYLTIVGGVIDKPAYIKGYLVKNKETNHVTVTRKPVKDSLPIETRYTPVSCSKDRSVTLLKVELLTGRSHQIRSHLASIGHPVAGDWKYGDSRLNRRYKEMYGVQSQLLHSWKLILPAEKGELQNLSGLEIIAPVPETFANVIKGEKINGEKI